MAFFGPIVAPLARDLTRAVLPGLALCSLALDPSNVIAAEPAYAPIAMPPEGAGAVPPLAQPKPHQRVTVGPPPRPPALFNPDAGGRLVGPGRTPGEDGSRQLRRTNIVSRWPDPPGPFNPDPGASLKRPVAPREPMFPRLFTPPPPFGSEPLPPELQWPRSGVRRSEIVEQPAPRTESTFTGNAPLPVNQQLPRLNTRANEHIEFDFHNLNYPINQQLIGYPPDSLPTPNRWRIGFTPWRRYTDGSIEQPYETPQPLLWHPYKQSILKGDAPVIGQDIFLNLTATADTIAELRRIPTPSAISGARPDNAEFFGKSEQILVQNNLALAVELFKGETVFKPIEWAVRLQPVFNLNYADARETTVVSPDPRGGTLRDNRPPPDNGFVLNPGHIDQLLAQDGRFVRIGDDLHGTVRTTRTRDYYALQEGFVEVHVSDLSENYDFIAARAGNQPFNSDFRGFIFNDINLGARVFGNIDNNRYQYNLIAFDLNEKDTNSELNTFDRRDQRVFILNLYRQDFLWKGYTAQLSFHANLDQGGRLYDRNGFVVRPAPIGTVRDHDVRAYYFGWAGDGHIGRFNLTHAFYQVFGRDEFNGVAGRPTDINAQMAALELSYDRDWIRYSASAFYASGDNKAEDGHARGFDTIIDNPNFTGGPFSYYVRQGFNLAGSSVGFKQRNSLVPDLRTSKTQGQANFVNPGVHVLGLGAALDVTPKLRSFFNANYIRLAETDPIKTVLLTDRIHHEIGFDLSTGVQYRPLLTDNIIVSAGFGALLPGGGFRDIYRLNTDPAPGYNSPHRAGAVDDFLYSALLAVTFTY